MESKFKPKKSKKKTPRYADFGNKPSREVWENMFPDVQWE
jgi:hypothetical protein